MNLRALTYLLTVLLLLASASPPAAADVQADAMAQQRKAVDAYVQLRETFRRTNQSAPLRRELLAVDAELALSTQALQGLNLHAEVAAGLLWRARLASLLDDDDLAAQRFVEAAKAALQAGDAAQQASAWAGKARVEMLRKQPAVAVEDARRAIVLAPASGSADAQSAAWGVLVAVLAERGEMRAARDASVRQFAAAALAEDPVQRYLTYFGRMSMHMQDIKDCDPLGDIVPCLQAHDAAIADLDSANAIATQLGYTALALRASELRALYANTRALIERRGP